MKTRKETLTTSCGFTFEATLPVIDADVMARIKAKADELGVTIPVPSRTELADDIFNAAKNFTFTGKNDPNSIYQFGN